MQRVSLVDQAGIGAIRYQLQRLMLVREEHRRGDRGRMSPVVAPRAPLGLRSLPESYCTDVQVGTVVMGFLEGGVRSPRSSPQPVDHNLMLPSFQDRKIHRARRSDVGIMRTL